MRISKKGLDLIKKWEGCRLTAYEDSTGVWTIGWGTTNSDIALTNTYLTEGVKISQKTADEWLERSVNSKYAPRVESYHHIYNFNQNQFDALVSFCYNIGSINQLTANGTRSIEEIASHMTEYVHAGGKVLQGLVNRRNDEVALFNKPVDKHRTKTIRELANEVIQGKYGNGEERKKALGELYDEVQEEVNKILKPMYTVTYKVKAGDTLTHIAKRYNTTIQKIAQDNNIKDVNKIYIGQELKIIC